MYLLSFIRNRFSFIYGTSLATVYRYFILYNFVFFMATNEFNSYGNTNEVNSCGAIY